MAGASYREMALLKRLSAAAPEDHQHEGEGAPDGRKTPTGSVDTGTAGKALLSGNWGVLKATIHAAVTLSHMSHLPRRRRGSKHEESRGVHQEFHPRTLLNAKDTEKARTTYHANHEAMASVCGVHNLLIESCGLSVSPVLLDELLQSLDVLSKGGRFFLSEDSFLDLIALLQMDSARMRDSYVESDDQLLTLACDEIGADNTKETLDALAAQAAPPPPPRTRGSLAAPPTFPDDEPIKIPYEKLSKLLQVESDEQVPALRSGQSFRDSVVFGTDKEFPDTRYAGQRVRRTSFKDDTSSTTPGGAGSPLLPDAFLYKSASFPSVASPSASRTPRHTSLLSPQLQQRKSRGGNVPPSAQHPSLSPFVVPISSQDTPPSSYSEGLEHSGERQGSAHTPQRQQQQRQRPDSFSLDQSVSPKKKVDDGSMPPFAKPTVVVGSRVHPSGSLLGKSAASTPASLHRGGSSTSLNAGRLDGPSSEHPTFLLGEGPRSATAPLVVGEDEEGAPLVLFQSEGRSDRRQSRINDILDRKRKAREERNRPWTVDPHTNAAQEEGRRRRYVSDSHRMPESVFMEEAKKIDSGKLNMADAEKLRRRLCPPGKLKSIDVSESRISLVQSVAGVTLGSQPKGIEKLPPRLQRWTRSH